MLLSTMNHREVDWIRILLESNLNYTDLFENYVRCQEGHTDRLV